MVNKKLTRKYYFTVEGKTEKWYLDWLSNVINKTEESKYKVSFDCKVEKNPLKRAKSIFNINKVTIWHFSDYESSDEVHTKQFTDTMDNMREAMNLKRGITYKFGYSNFTFDLWIILHKDNCNGPLAHRDMYIERINKAYDEHFESMDQYKEKDNFNKCLKKLKLSYVIKAVNRAKSIMKNNEEIYYPKHYKGFSYYDENPSLTVWEIIEIILKDCGLLT